MGVFEAHVTDSSRFMMHRQVSEADQSQWLVERRVQELESIVITMEAQLDKQAQADAAKIHNLTQDLTASRQDTLNLEAQFDIIDGQYKEAAAEWGRRVEQEQQKNGELQAEVDGMIHKFSMTLDKERSSKDQLGVQYEHRGKGMRQLEEQLADQQQKTSMLEELVRRQQQAFERQMHTNFGHQMMGKDRDLSKALNRIEMLERQLSDATQRAKQCSSEGSAVGVGTHNETAVQSVGLRDPDGAVIASVLTIKHQEAMTAEFADLRSELRLAREESAAWEAHCNKLLERLSVYADIVERGCFDVRPGMVVRTSHGIHEPEASYHEREQREWQMNEGPYGNE